MKLWFFFLFLCSVERYTSNMLQLIQKIDTWKMNEGNSKRSANIMESISLHGEIEEER